MLVELIASTRFDAVTFQEATGFQSEPWTPSADLLAEAAGRQCYEAWERKNPATATNRGYLANIIDHQHFSVLEHASATFLVHGVSRSLLAELTRHRHLSFSVESQRYVDQTGREPAVPPALRGTDMEGDLHAFHAEAVDLYVQVRNALAEQGVPRKQAREAARAFLLNAQPVNLIVTGNLRAWREVLTKRYHVAADAEIRELADEILTHLRCIAPSTFQDFGDVIGNEEIRRAA
ncbi:flavin-dependent thymidylate synthase [Sphaerisporangium siamense]|uniref:FAD-dependent thymidylate synthase n=1 Tax=Sphaerisporangium siamense TaxID=795645 RepID=A0A7W7D9S1_9ACTN|nr:FAD-dependent thymidylate synthase [Sphaerisporangium siamense]MBB4702898.1 thymidylate synthase (FAD) [Sphaerisporangium siamense]GII83343.1 flavin-dependent thymidylate synthase [Sphaerisporangium siamense]